MRCGGNSCRSQHGGGGGVGMREPVDRENNRPGPTVGPSGPVYGRFQPDGWENFPV